MIIPLGGGYLELMTVAEPSIAERSEVAAALHRRLHSEAGRLIGWSIAVEGIEAIAERLGTPLATIAREGLSARLTALGEALADPSLPFFIERDPGVADPGEPGDAGGITWIEVAGDRRRLNEWLGGVELPVRVTAGTRGVRAVGIGDREFRPAG